MKFEEKTRGGYDYEILDELKEPYIGNRPIMGKVYASNTWYPTVWSKSGMSKVFYSVRPDEETLVRSKDFDLVPEPEYFWAVKPHLYDHGRIFEHSQDAEYRTGDELFKVVRVPDGMKVEFVPEE